VAAGMAAARDRGVRLGRPASPVPDSGRRIQELRDEGLSLNAIADALNSEGVASPSGKAWTKSSVQYVLRRVESRGDSTG
jgi:DNA invertase Pin-like site-specific DNA recombinase